MTEKVKGTDPAAPHAAAAAVAHLRQGRGPALAQGLPTADGEALSASLEDYVEAILGLERVSRVARVSEIAERLGVSRPSVTGALKNLAARGLVAHARYGHVTLTEEGTRVAVDVERRHVAIRDFLTDILGIPEDKAEAAACRLEHVLEPDVLAHFISYSERLAAARDCPGNLPEARS